MWPNLLNMFKGKVGGAEMTPYKDLKAEELAAWQGYDPNNQKSRATQYANAAAQQQQEPMMFGQFGDAGKKMGDIWGQVKSGVQEGAKNIGEKAGQFGDDWQANYDAMLKQQGHMPEKQENPFGKPKPTQEELNTVLESNKTPQGSDLDQNNIPDLIQAPEGNPRTIGDLPQQVDKDGNKIPDYIQAPGKYGHGKTAGGDHIITPGSENIFGMKTPPMTPRGLHEMQMAGFTGGGSNIGKFWSQIRNWMK